MKKKQILLVDDEAYILDMISWYLSEDQEIYDIISAESAEQAIEIIAREAISLVVADINMGGMSGLDLLAYIRNRYPQIKVILMTGEKSEQIRKDVQQSGCLHFLQKPLEMKSLKKLIADELGKTDEGFCGTLKNIHLTDLIQLCCHAAINTAIRVFKGGKDGMIFIREGEIAHAVCGDNIGESAFYEILGWKSGRFETLGEMPISQISISKSWHHLLMEAARKTDEGENTSHVSCLTSHAKTRVLIADDSSMMCKVLSELLSSDKDIGIAGTARNGEEVLVKMEELKPDIITLDVNMPVMDGITALKHIMIKKPCPVVMLSSVGEEKQSSMADCLRLGAVDFLSKPVRSKDMSIQRRQLTQRIRQAASARMENFRRMKEPKPLGDKLPVGSENPCGKLVIVNSGIGGYADLLEILCASVPLPLCASSCIVVFQTMLKEFVTHLSEYFDQRSRFRVLPLQETICAGYCYIGANDTGNNEFDRFLTSLDKTDVTIVLLSGACIGNINILNEIHQQGARIIVQKPSLCMVSDPIENVIRAGIADRELATADIIAEIF